MFEGGGHMTKTVALVGRPNVGKSTVFNRLVGKKISIIDDAPGITRDRIYGVSEYSGFRFHVIDTGGIDATPLDFNKEIMMQAELAIDEADVVIFIVDGKDGLNPNDYLVRDILKKSKKDIIVAINKIDNKKHLDNIYDFYELGFDEYIPISGEHNLGIGDLLDAVVAHFDESSDPVYADNVVKFSVLGRPNVGKSSLVNAILKQNRVIVSDVAGTTRDAIDTPFTNEHGDFVVIDTAGIRKRGKVYENIEKYSVLRAMKAIERSDVCLLVINADEGIIEQDKHIAQYILEANKAIVVVVNKWDKVKEVSIKQFTDKIRSEFKFIPYAEIVFLSAMTKSRMSLLLPEVLAAFNNSKKEIPTSAINNVIGDALLANPSPMYKGKRLKIYFAHQIGTQPPKFLFRVNNKTLIHFSYERYLENRLRENFDFRGTPIVLTFKNKGEID